MHQINASNRSRSHLIVCSIRLAQIDKRSGRVYGPPGSKKLVYYLDDLNMPLLDEFGTQSPLCLVRQHMDYGSWFDTARLEKKDIRDVQYIASMNPTAGSFLVDPRLQGHFATFACLLPSRLGALVLFRNTLPTSVRVFPVHSAILTSVYNTVMENHLCNPKFPFAKVCSLECLVS